MHYNRISADCHLDLIWLPVARNGHSVQGSRVEPPNQAARKLSSRMRQSASEICESPS